MGRMRGSGILANTCILDLFSSYLRLLGELRVFQGQIHGALDALVAVRQLLWRQPGDGSLHIRMPLVANVIKLQACTIEGSGK